MLLRVDVRIDAHRRTYDDAEAARLRDVFGERSMWGRSLGGLLWARVAVVVPAFERATSVDVIAPCAFDAHAATLAYFAALSSGDVPVSLLFAGTVFYDDDGARAAPLPRSAEASLAMPYAVYAAAAARVFGGRTPLALPRDTFDRLREYQRRAGLATCEQALDRLLSEAKR
jgi:hypothetical protein